MKIAKATALYEAWLRRHLRLLPRDLALKHGAMRESAFAFLRATFYRWAQGWPEVCDDLAAAPKVLSVGDLHVENFGTWRDAEGRLVWGVNDFDEAWQVPYTNDLVRLATSANLAIAAHDLAVDERGAAEAILSGYRDGLASGGRPFVLAEHHGALRDMATHRLHEPERYWEKLDGLPTWRGSLPAGARRAIARLMPQRQLAYRIVHRVAGLGSLGRERYVGIAEWHGGHVAREAKALAPSAWVWASRRERAAAILYQEIVDRAVRCRDPFVRLQRRWIARRLAPDCSRIELKALPGERDVVRLLRAMGFETANVHLGTGKAKKLRADLKRRGPRWLEEAARRMTDAVVADWREWRRDA